MIEIPGYKIVRTLGRGGMATVYLAIQESFEREVALKVMSAALSDDPKFTARFLLEARVVSRLVHPNIVTVYDVGVQENQHYLSMEYVPGTDLKQKHQFLTPVQGLHIIRDVAKALDYAGKKGYVHRDVKPENIMLHDEDGRAVLMDFGIACLVDSRSGMTQTGTTIGTPHYMSPEQAKGRQVDSRADIYSLGVVLFQLLAGHVPYDGDSAVAVGIKHIQDPIPRLPGNLRVLQPIIDKSMAKDPSHRYQTGAELIAAIDAVTDEDIEAIQLATRHYSAHTQETAYAPDSDQSGEDPNAATLVNPITAGDQSMAETTLATATPANGQPLAPEPDNTGPAGNDTAPERPRDILSVAVEDRRDYADDAGRARRWPWALVATVVLAVAGGVYFRDYLPPPIAAVIGTAENKLAAALGRPEVATPPEAAAQVASEIAAAAAAEASTKVASTKVAMEQTAEQPTGKPAEQPPEYTAGQPVEQPAVTSSPVLEDPAKLVQPEAVPEPAIAADEPVVASVNAGSTTTPAESGRNATVLTQASPAKRPDEVATQDPGIQDPVVEDPAVKQARILREQREKQLQQAIAQAEDYLAADALTEPAGANALEAYRRALEIDPENPRAKAGLNTIADRYVTLSRAALADGKLEQALDLANRGLGVNQQHPALGQLRSRAGAELERQRNIERLTNLARERMSAENYISPRGESAYDYYRQVLALDAANEQALSGLTQVEQTLVQSVETHINRNQFDQARSLLLEARNVLTGSERLLSLELALERAIEADFLARQPRIPQVLVSGQPLDDISQTPVQSVSVDRTIHIGFSYQNFEPKTSVVQVMLYDGSRSLQIAQTPVIVSGKDGVKFFQIDRPVEGFPEGGYNIDLILNNNRLGTLSFKVDRSQPSSSREVTTATDAPGPNGASQ